MTTIQTKSRRLADTEVFPIGFGGMPLALSGRPDEAQGDPRHPRRGRRRRDPDRHRRRLLHRRGRGRPQRAADRQGLKGRRDDVLVATKAGHIRPGGAWELDGRPEHIRAACEASLKALDTDRIDLYQFHRPDPNVPYAESVGAFKELQDEGKVRWVGLSNCTVEQLEEALGIVEIVAVQNQLSLGYTSPLAKGEVDACTQRGIAFLPWSPLGGIGKADSNATVDAVRTAAETHDVSPQQVALAWLLAQGPTVIPIPGSTKVENITDSIRAAELELSDEEIAAISQAAAA